MVVLFGTAVAEVARSSRMAEVSTIEATALLEESDIEFEAV